MGSDKPGWQSPYKELGRAMRERRVALGWSLRKAAQLIGEFSHSRLQDFERGEDPHSARPTRPTEAQLRRIATVYELEPGDLLGLAGYQPLGPLAEWEIELIRRARAAPPHMREGLFEYLVRGGEPEEP